VARKKKQLLLNQQHQLLLSKLLQLSQQQLSQLLLSQQQLSQQRLSQQQHQLKKKRSKFNALAKAFVEYRKAPSESFGAFLLVCFFYSGCRLNH
jgi:hypothetical protein